MFAFIVQRLLQAVIVMVSVALISFMLFQYVGDPVVFLLGQDATPEQIRELRADLGLDKSFVVQFWNFLGNAVRGEFGLSLRQGSKVSRLIAERLPATLELAGIAALLALLLGIPMGVYAALKRGTFLSQLFMTVSLLGVSLPTFLVGILLILLFGLRLGWLPIAGTGAGPAETLTLAPRTSPCSPALSMYNSGAAASAAITAAPAAGCQAGRTARALWLRRARHFERARKAVISVGIQRSKERRAGAGMGTLSGCVQLRLM